MTDWRIGDLAVCVAVSLPGFAPSEILTLGKVYRVSNIYVSRRDGCLALILEGARPKLYPGWRAELFRKILPDEHAPCEIEFVELLNRSKRRVAC